MFCWVIMNCYTFAAADGQSWIDAVFHFHSKKLVQKNTTLKQTKSGRVRGSIFSRIFNIYTMFIKLCSCLYRGNNSKVHNIVTLDDLWHLATPLFEREKTEKLFINFVHQIILVIAILKKKKRWFVLRNYFKIC